MGEMMQSCRKEEIWRHSWPGNYFFKIMNFWKKFSQKYFEPQRQLCYWSDLTFNQTGMARVCYR